jgi:hypothetical protein
MENKKPAKKPIRNPNKRPCIARNITFSVQKENDELLRKMKGRGI